MTDIEKQRLREKAMLGTTYKVTFIPNVYEAVENRRHPNSYTNIIHSQKLILENINGYGCGTLFFVDKDNKLVVLDWVQIISMLPLKEDLELTPCEILQSDGTTKNVMAKRVVMKAEDYPIDKNTSGDFCIECGKGTNFNEI